MKTREEKCRHIEERHKVGSLSLFEKLVLLELDEMIDLQRRSGAELIRIGNLIEGSVPGKPVSLGMKFSKPQQEKKN